MHGRGGCTTTAPEGWTNLGLKMLKITEHPAQMSNCRDGTDGPGCPGVSVPGKLCAGAVSHGSVSFCPSHGCVHTQVREWVALSLHALLLSAEQGQWGSVELCGEVW